VLGANDGIVSTASILLGVAASGAERSALLTAGMAGLVAGSVAMAVGEYVSVASQRDTERSDIAKETWELQHEAEHELDELTAIYTARGLDRDLARQVAEQLTERDALGAHLRDELGIAPGDLARPVQAAASSAASFGVGAALPLIAASLASRSTRIGVILVVALLALVSLGFAGAKAGGAKYGRPVVRIVVGGVVAMAFTMVVGKLFGAAVG
jgi:VIT1/CCC1 family predicted Fe2+/Mn2+ transporter